MNLKLNRFISPVHDNLRIMESEKNINNFLKSKYNFTESNSEKGLTISWIMTGGTERAFKDAYERGEIKKPVILLASDLNNSLAASLEIISFIKSKGDVAYLIHGDEKHIEENINKFLHFENVLQKLEKSKIGVIGKPSDWLIASEVNYKQANLKWGTQFLDIPLEELYESIDSIKAENDDDYFSKALSVIEPSKTDILGAHKIYLGLKEIINKNSLNAFTLRCFDLLSRYKNTGCLALSRFNDNGITAGCEGDIPSVFTMHLIRTLTGQISFMANPSKVDTDLNKVVFAHCTVATAMTESYTLRSHFESGIGVGISGHIPEGDVTVLKVGGENLDRYFVSNGTILNNLHSEDRCRTQIEVQMDKNSITSLLNNPLGNHHIIVKGDYKCLIEEFMNYSNFKSVPFLQGK